MNRLLQAKVLAVLLLAGGTLRADNLGFLPIPAPGDIVRRGSLGPGDPLVNGRFRETHRVFLQGGRFHTIDLRSTDFDVLLEVRDLTGRLLARNDDGGPGLNARLRFRPPAHGFYQVVATSYRTGAHGRYVLTIDPAGNPGPIPPIPPVPPLPGPGTELVHRHACLTHASPLRDGKHYDLVPVFLQAGRTYVIEMNSRDFDAFVRLRHPQFGVVAANDDGGPGRNARLVFRPTRSGLYHIEATTYRREATGTYHLTAR